MTQDDAAAAIGRLVKRYSDAKQRRAAVVAELNAAALTLARLAETIGSSKHIEVKATSLSVPANYPDREALTALVAELNEVNRVIIESRPLLKDAGLNIE